MIDEKRLREVEINIPQYLKEGLITKEESNKRFVDFYVKNTKNSLDVARLLMKTSKDSKLKETMELKDDFECFLWVVVSSYYSMFYMANAALCSLGIKIGDELVHKITSDCLVFYFIKTRKLAKQYFEEYENSRNDVLELMATTEDIKFHDKAKKLIETFDFEKKKRGTFQYEITKSVKENIAETSINRAKTFLFELERLII